MKKFPLFIFLVFLFLVGCKEESATLFNENSSEIDLKALSEEYNQTQSIDYKKSLFFNANAKIRTNYIFNELWVFVNSDNNTLGEELFILQVSRAEQELNIAKDFLDAEVLLFPRSAMIIKPKNEKKPIYFGWSLEKTRNIIQSLELNHLAEGFGFIQRTSFGGISPDHKIFNEKIATTRQDTYDTICEYSDAVGDEEACDAGGDNSIECSLEGECSVGCNPNSSVYACCGNFPDYDGGLLQGIVWSTQCKCCDD